MKLSFSVLALGIASLVTAQKAVTYLEPASKVSYRIGIPENTTSAWDIYVQIVSPINNTYGAIAFGGCMLRSPIVVAWVASVGNSRNIVAVPRWADAYHPPAPYPNATVTVVKSASGVNATHWWAGVVCTGCSTWLGGSVPTKGEAVFGYGVANRTFSTASGVNSSIPFHNVAKGHMEVNVTTARNSASDWSMLLMGM